MKNTFTPKAVTGFFFPDGENKIDLDKISQAGGDDILEQNLCVIFGISALDAQLLKRIASVLDHERFEQRVTSFFEKPDNSPITVPTSENSDAEQPEVLAVVL